MAQSIRNIVCKINESLATVFKGAIFYGVASQVKTENTYQPVVNEKPVSYDDSYGLQAYHKINGAVISKTKGYGREENTINTFNMSMIVFNNEISTKMKSDEIAMILQAYFYKISISESITPLNFILNTEVIFGTEYRGHTFSIPESMSLMQFNYTVAISFKSGCFDLCPEDFSHCKNN